MKCVFIRKTKGSLPTRRLREFLDFSVRSLRRQKILPKESRELVVAFVNSTEGRQLNREFRGKDYATDVLSFAPSEPGYLGELVICPEVIQRQAKEHGLTEFAEYSYMILHGMLHLLGYDHETDDKAARRMYRLQDKIFYSYFRGSRACQLQRKRPK